MVVLYILFAIISMLIILIVGKIAVEELEMDFGWLTEPRKLKRKNKALELDNTELKKVVAKQAIELTARRNGLDWVDVEEINGTQE